MTTDSMVFGFRIELLHKADEFRDAIGNYSSSRELARFIHGEKRCLPGIKAMLLSNEERTKFAQWCEQEAISTQAILQQMEKMKLPEAFTKKQRIELAAVKVVHKMLTSGEQQTIGGSDVTSGKQDNGPNTTGSGT